ncbi:MAG TPA: TonB-dependent receptor [Candidatus Sulfotelmatobacter sp.]|nr:TonB-dependent receptor [Candidatus Sulfotelmatobacter sp.]
MKQGVQNFIRRYGLVFAIVSLLSLAAVSAFGQAIDGNVVGTVTDASGAAVVGAEVTATNVATNITASTKTGATGDYRFDHLLPGTYRINARATGFKTINEQVDVEVNKTATRNVMLTPGATSETIEVSGTPPTLDTTTAQIQSTYETRETQDLPTASVGLGVLNLSLLQAGVGSTGGLGAGSGPSIGGQRPRDNNFTIEGTDNNDKGVTGPLIYVPNDAVQNFSVLQNQFSPEFGHSNGGQFNTIVISGTNSYHGRLYEYFQNRNLNALDTSLSNQGITTMPRYDNNRFGGQVGGPVIKDKLFFFANFEYNPVGEATSSGSVICAPTSAGYTALLGVPGVSSSNVQGLQLYAQAPSADASGKCKQLTVQGTSGGPVPIEIGILPVIAPNYLNTRALVTSMDYNLSDRDQIRGRYIYNKLVTLDNLAQLGTFYTPFLQPYHIVSLSEYHTFSGSLGNEFRVGFTRTAQDYTVPGGSLAKFQNLDAFPNLTIDNLGGLNVGPDPNAPQYAVQNNYQAIDNVSWVKGNHTLKFGIEGRKNISPQLFIQRARGDYDWTTLQGFALDQTPDHIAERSFGSAGYSGDQYGIFWFVNDIWKVRPNFSLNLGLRYEYTSTPFGWTQQALNSVADVPGLITFASPAAPTKDFMPRIGFAYSPGRSGNTSIRGGFGLGYDVLYDNIGTLARPPQIGSTVDCPGGTGCPTGGFLAGGGIPPQNLSGITVLDPATARANTSAFLPANVKYPYAESWNFGIQHVFKSNYTVDVRYVGSRGVDLNVQNRLNFIPGITAATAVPTYLQAPTQATLNGLTNAWAQCDPTAIITLNGLAVCQNMSLSNGGYGDAPGTLSYGYNDTGVPPGGGYDPVYYDAGFYSSITAYEPWGASTYHGLQTQLNRRFSNGLQFQVAWTWSHTIDNSTADFFSTVISPRRPQDFRDLPAERSNSILNHAHRLTLTSIYDVPWFRSNPNWFMKNVLGNFEFAPVYTYESGQWGTVQSGVDTNLNYDAAGDRAIYNPAGVKGTGSDVYGLVATSGPQAGNIVAYQAVNPNAQYILAQQGTIATSSRNTLQTPAINNWDITAMKHIAVTERLRVDFLAQAFNLFNHPQWVTGSLNNVNNISDTTGFEEYFRPNSANFNIARTTFPSNARTMQLGLKFIF